jgi:hypothetical protein
MTRIQPQHYPTRATCCYPGRMRNATKPLRLRLLFVVTLIILLHLGTQRYNFATHKSTTTTSLNLDPKSPLENHRNMGTSSSRAAISSKPKDYITQHDNDTVYVLKKKRAGCTGMFWRSDPTHQVTLENNNDWPKDGAFLKGEVRVVNGTQWLAATHVQNVGNSWKEAPYGAHMPFEYDNHYYLEVLK